MFQPLPTDRGPVYLAVSASLQADATVTYRILKVQHGQSRMSTTQAGSAAPSCGHLTCRLANLGAAAVDWAYLLQLDEGPDEFHPEQMGFDLGPE